MQILHLTAHLGGGVGKVLSGLVGQARLTDSECKHVIVCLEKPEKNQFIDKVLASGGRVFVCPDYRRLEKLLKDADVVQLDWWNHPATIKYLCSMAIPPIRLLTWCHTSGLYNPIIPPDLMKTSEKFVFTSKCSYEGKEVKSLLPAFQDRFDVVSSCGGYDGLPETNLAMEKSMSVGYIGSLNFAKLHPRYVDYLATVKIPAFKVRIIGDLMNQDVLNRQCEQAGKPGMLEFTGYTNDIVAGLAPVNVLAYLLNPEHYGTAENALLEAMAMGIAPIVLDNPAERQIVEDHETGLIIHSPTEFAQAIEWLAENPAERQELSRQAAKSVRDKFSVAKMASALSSHYREIIPKQKKNINFIEIFGSDPAQWFLSCQRDKHIFAKDGSINADSTTPLSYGLFEKTKGTVFHFHSYFPNSLKLASWAEKLETIGKMQGIL